MGTVRPVRPACRFWRSHISLIWTLIWTFHIWILIYSMRPIQWWSPNRILWTLTTPVWPVGWHLPILGANTNIVKEPMDGRDVDKYAEYCQPLICITWLTPGTNEDSYVNPAAKAAVGQEAPPTAACLHWSPSKNWRRKKRGRGLEEEEAAAAP
jgi:hypothetical protein